MKPWTCPHGAGPEARRGDCEPCNAEIAGRPDPASMTGDARAAELSDLLNEPSAFRVRDMHERIEGLVGRPVWTHEFVQDLALMHEARTWEHPADLHDHILRTAEAAADGKPVISLDVP